MLQCIKTGANIQLATRWAHGDLFQLGLGGCVMNVSQWGHSIHKMYQDHPNTLIHAEFDTWLQWFGETEDISHNVSVVILPMPLWFNYDGKICNGQ